MMYAAEKCKAAAFEMRDSLSVAPDHGGRPALNSSSAAEHVMEHLATARGEMLSFSCQGFSCHYLSAIIISFFFIQF